MTSCLQPLAGASLSAARGCFAVSRSRVLRCKLAAIPTYLAPAASCTQEAAAARRGTVGTVQSVPTVRVHSLTVRVHSLPAAPTCFAASTKTARLFCAPCYGMCSVPHMADVQKSCAEKHDALVHVMSAPQQPSCAESLMLCGHVGKEWACSGGEGAFLVME